MACDLSNCSNFQVTVVKREGQLRETVCRLMVRGAAGEIEYDKVPYDMPPYGNIFGMSRADLTYAHAPCDSSQAAQTLTPKALCFHWSWRDRANDGKIIECALHNVGRPGAMMYGQQTRQFV